MCARLHPGTVHPGREAGNGWARRRFRAACVALSGLLAAALPACHQPGKPAERPPEIDASVAKPSADSHSVADTVSLPILPLLVDDQDQWLFVETARDKMGGAWATGSFHAERNKIEIETHNVRQFTIDASRIPIRWQDVVIIGIDGRNSELRQRDELVLRFVRNGSGQWVVMEP